MFRRGCVWAVTYSTLWGCRFEEGQYVPESDLVNWLGYTCAAPCDCRGAAQEFAGFGSPECEAQIEGWVGDAQSSAADVFYSQKCAERLIERIFEFDNSEDACATEPEVVLEWLSCEDECQIYYGTAAVGEPCERFGRRMSTCAADLTCAFDGRCYEPCDQPLVIPAGGTCSYAAGVLEAKCDAVLACDPVGGTCVEQPSSGVPCDPETPLCLPEEGCSEDTAMCEPRMPLDAPCDAHQDCESSVCQQTCQPAAPYQCDHPWF